MTRRASLFEFMPYGAPELIEGSRPYMARALTLGSALWCLLFATALAIVAVAPKPGRIVITPPLPPIIDLEPTPKWDVERQPIPKTDPTPARTDHQGIFLPVRDEPSTTVVDPRAGTATSENGTGTSHEPVIVGEAGAPAAIDPYQEYDLGAVSVLPAEVVTPKPEYPEPARSFGVEGLVVIQVAIGPDGRVRRAKVVQSVPLLDDAALGAARRWVFTPALVSGHPVTVLYNIPFRFTLH